MYVTVQDLADLVVLTLDALHARREFPHRQALADALRDVAADVATLFKGDADFLIDRVTDRPSFAALQEAVPPVNGG